MSSVDLASDYPVLRKEVSAFKSALFAPTQV
jgi:hypothetical protein